MYGEVVGIAWAVTTALGQLSERLWRQLRDFLDYLESAWQEPDDGIWEARGPRRHYTQSKVMAWLAFDRAIALSKRFKLERATAALGADPRANPRRNPRAGRPSALYGRAFAGPDILDGTIEPGRVFDRTIDLEEVPDGYRAMASRESFNVLIRP